MEVWDFFAAVGAVVNDGAEAGFGEAFLLGNLLDGEHEVAEECLVSWIGLGDADDAFLGNHEEVDGGLWGDVAEANALLILVDDV